MRNKNALTLENKEILCVTHKKIISPISRPPSIAKIEILLALNVHEHNPAGEAHRHHNQLCHERPFKSICSHLLSTSLDQHTKTPNDAERCSKMKEHRTKQPSLFDARHLQTLPFAEWLDFRLNDERIFAEFT